MLGDEWTDDDDKIHCVVVASEDAAVVPGVDEECYRLYDATMEGSATRTCETDYYDLTNMTAGSAETVDEVRRNSVYEKLKIVARKRRDFLADLVYLFPNRATLFYED